MSHSARRATTTRPIPPRLLRAYRDTTYRVVEVAVRIGRRCPDALFDRLDGRAAVLLTAWNPLSRRMPDGWNHRMQQNLRRQLRRFAVLEADGSLHRWREAMLLVAGDPRPCIRAAARFRQHAVVILRRGHRARVRLVCYRDMRRPWLGSSLQLTESREGH